MEPTAKARQSNDGRNWFASTQTEVIGGPWSPDIDLCQVVGPFEASADAGADARQ